MIGSLKVIQEGVFTTIQDEGRLGFRKYGVPQSGAMDIRAMHYANFLVHNTLGAPVLEFTWKGGKYQFGTDAFIALTGAEMDLKINGSPHSMYQSIKVNKGDILELNFAKKGMRSYLALHGSLRVPKIMNSYSTYILAGIGGFHGRMLQAGDIISWTYKKNLPLDMRKIPEHLIPVFSERIKIIRIIDGPESSWIKNGTDIEAIPYEILPESDRMGIKLKGKAIDLDRGNIISSATVPGTIQLPDKGSPIVLMKDAQTSGGYPRIGKVIDIDLSTISQVRPGDKIRFKKVMIDEARKLWRYHMKVMASLQEF